MNRRGGQSRDGRPRGRRRCCSASRSATGGTRSGRGGGDAGAHLDRGQSRCGGGGESRCTGVFHGGLSRRVLHLHSARRQRRDGAEGCGTNSARTVAGTDTRTIVRRSAGGSAADSPGLVGAAGRCGDRGRIRSGSRFDRRRSDRGSRSRRTAAGHQGTGEDEGCGAVGKRSQQRMQRPGCCSRRNGFFHYDRFLFSMDERVIHCAMRLWGTVEPPGRPDTRRRSFR